MDSPAPYRVSRTAMLLVGVGILFFTVYATLSRYNLDRYGDMVENYGWGIGWQLGYLKHPPLFAWIVAAFFEIAPRTDAAYYLLSALNSGTAVLLVLLASRRFLDERGQMALVVIAYMIPAFGFMAIKYNANSAMLPFWAGCLLFYLRLLERRTIGEAVMLGLFGGLAMLAKYHSVVLILSFALFTLWDREARRLLRTPLPWIASAVALLVFLPHAVWLFRNEFVTITYAAHQGQATLAGQVAGVGAFIGAFVARLLPAMLYLGLFWRRPDGFPFNAPAAFATLVSDSQGRAVVAAAIGPGLLTVLLAITMGTPLTETWSIPCVIPYPILFAVALPSHVHRERPLLAWGVLAVLAALVLAAAPAVRSERFGRAAHYADLPLKDAVDEIETLYEQATGQSLRIVGGEPVASYGMAFYGQGRIRAVAGPDIAHFPWVARADIDRLGGAYLCVSRPMPACRRGAGRFLGRVDGSERFTLPPTPEIHGSRPFSITMFYRRPEGPAISGQ